MLQEFTRDVLKDIEDAKRSEIEKLIACDGSSGRHDYIRGAIQALDATGSRVRALVTRYSDEAKADVEPANDDRAQNLRRYRRGA